MAIPQSLPEHRVDLVKVRALRKRANLTQTQVATALGYRSAVGYHYVETGRCRLRADQLLVLARLFGVGIEALVDTAVIDVVDSTAS